MKINHTTPYGFPLPHVGPQLKGSSPLRAIFRPFIQPFIQHRFVRPAIQSNIRPDRRMDGPATHTHAGNHDATQRPDDPYIHKTNRQSFNKQRAIEQLTRPAAKWRDSNQNNQTEISYSFKQGFGAGFNEQQKQSARRSIESWGDVANLAFTENGGPAEGQLSFSVNGSIGVADGTYPHAHHGHTRGGDTRYNPNHVKRHTITHEIGHALGLSHPGDYDGRPDDTKRIYAQDSKAHTVMSYYSAQPSGKKMEGNPLAPMMDDISAIQRQYGVNHQTRREDNTYGFNSNTGRDYYSLRSNRDAAVFCIWDGAGNDTLDVSGYQHKQVINLRAGSFSDVGGDQGNVSIARNCLIENAIGGAGNDALIGNEADNRLTGGGGGDRLRGGGGANTFVYNRASDSTPENPDEIMDFTSGTDTVDVSQALRNAGLSSLAFVSAFSGKAGETLLTYDEKTGKGSVSIDTTGDGKATLQITTHGQVKPDDIVHAHDSRRIPRVATSSITPHVDTTEPRPRFIFNKASESDMTNSRLLTNFISGTDKIDLRGVQQETNVRFTLVKAFTGRIGDTVVTFNRYTQRYFIAVDLTGNRRTDFLVRSTGLIRPGDVIAG